MLSLQHPYISIALPHGKSYGGGQQLSRDAMLRRCGCGVVAAADLLLEYGVVLSPVVENRDYFRAHARTLPFFQNVQREGVRLRD